MRLGIDVSQHQQTWDELRSRVRFAEEAGFESAWVFDHFKPLYADPNGPCMEGWTLLAALAASTRRIRLGALVTGVTYRHPSVLAAEAVTVDHVSDGRLELGIGAAWFEGEHDQLGIAFPSTRERTRRLEEALNILKLLMTQDGASFMGRHYELSGAIYNPKPVQKPHPPIWVGASGERVTIPIAGRHADVWHTFGSVDTLKRRARILDEAAEKAGRDPATITRSTMLSISEPWDEVTRRARANQEAGYSYLIVSWPGEGRARVEEFLDEVGRDLTAS
jgi:F420-dependent oxidoreductase-like protein